jgi:hypothetical protein
MRFRWQKHRTPAVLNEIRDDGGSIAPLAILGVLVSLVLALVVLSADQLFQQQRNLNSVSDALALDLADLKLQPKTKLDSTVAAQELARVSGGLRGARPHLVQLLEPSENRVLVRVCQQNRLLEMPITGMLSGHVLAEICVTSTAENL